MERNNFSINLKTITFMKGLRFLLLGMAICLASGVKAQFYDSANDIYYYVEESRDGKSISKQNQNVYVFNFDGMKACRLAIDLVKTAQSHLRENSDYYGAMVETKKYDLEYKSSSYGVCYVSSDVSSIPFDAGGTRFFGDTFTYTFSQDRETLKIEDKRHGSGGYNNFGYPMPDYDGIISSVLRKVDKDYILNEFFGEGRQRK